MEIVRDFLSQMTGTNRGLFLLSGDKVYVGLGYASEAVRFFADRSAVILGLEGFSTDGTHLKPLLDFIADFDLRGRSADRGKLSSEAALRTLAVWERENRAEFVEFVIEE